MRFNVRVLIKLALVILFALAVECWQLLPPASVARTEPSLAEGVCSGASPDSGWKTVDYPAGWSLIGGPKGSCLEGASVLYAIEPSSLNSVDGGDPYILLPDTSAVPSGDYAFWAYFPSGGRVILSPLPVIGCGGPGSFASDGGFLGQWTAVPNPSSDGSATVSGGSELQLWSPAAGYYSASEIPLGQGAWVIPNSDTLTIQYSAIRC